MFWDGISLELTGHDDRLQKHFPGWMRRTTTKEQVLNVLLSSAPKDFDYDDSIGVFVHTGDVTLRIVLEHGQSRRKSSMSPGYIGSRIPKVQGNLSTSTTAKRVCKRCHACMSMEAGMLRSEEHTSELQSRQYLVCRLLLEKKKNTCK